MNKSLALFVLVLLVSIRLAAQDVVKEDDSSFNLNKPERVEWFRQAGAGLFIHFGVDAQLGIVISHSLVGASEEYVNRYFDQLPRTFDPAHFDPHAIAVLAKLAGMKYIVFTTKHHAGFCLWDTRTTDFNSMNTPYHGDMVKAFVEATRAEGLGVGLYFSPEDFHFLHAHGIPINRGLVPMDSGTRRQYDDYTRRQCEELMTQYGKIDVLFIDGEPTETVKRTCWHLQPDILITRGAMKTPEQVLPGARIMGPWLSCFTMGTAWQYQPTNEVYKTGAQLIGLAVEARAKGGSLLLNVGPRADGELSAEQDGLLREFAAWYFINHDCLDSVQPWTVCRQDNIWFTASGDSTLYAIITGVPDWPEDQRRTFVLHSVMATDATRISVLGQNSQIIEYRSADVSCRYRQTSQGLEVSVVKAQRIYDGHHWPNPLVIKLEKIRPSPGVAGPAVIPLPVSMEKAGDAPFVCGRSTVIGYTDPVLLPTVGLLNGYLVAIGDHAHPLQTSQGGQGDIVLRLDPIAVPWPEGYRLRIGSQGIQVTGHDAAGVGYGVQTLRQLALLTRNTRLVRGSLRPSDQMISIPAYTIDDHPRFSYRGMHLDAGRHFYPVSFVKQFIDWLALYKFNTFHWHLTDDQGWRIAIRKYPRLQTVAAWRRETLVGHKRGLPHRFDHRPYGGCYSQEEVREIVRYAAERHITIIPEIEMPGHALAALAAYPWLGCTGGPYRPATYWGVFDDVFCAGNDSVFTFLQGVLDEVMELFPSSYIHIGGDECPKTRWAVCPKCRRRMQELGLTDEEALQSYFVKRIAEYVRSKGRHVIGWDEILEGGLASDATVMSWRGESGGIAAANQGHRVIMTPEDRLYFDYYQSLHPGEPLAAGGYTPLRKVYDYDPLAAVPAGARDKIAGIQGALWTEYIADTAKLAYMMLPRAAALAEAAWTAPEHRDLEYPDFLRRWRSQKLAGMPLSAHSFDRFDEIAYTAGTEAGKIHIRLTSDLPDAVIRYTVDGRLPGKDSKEYDSPILLTKSCTLMAMLYHDGRPYGRLFTQPFRLHLGVGAKVDLATKPIARFDPGADALVNGISGNALYNDGQWLGFGADGLEGTVDLGVLQSVHAVGMNILEYHWQKMWAPASLQFFVSADGTHFSEVYRQDSFPFNGINRVYHAFPVRKARYIKVKAAAQGKIPAGEYGAGETALLMADELIIE